MTWESVAKSVTTPPNAACIPLKTVVPKVGFEPTRCRQRGILNPLRLPFRHLGHGASLSQSRARRPVGAAKFAGFRPEA